MTKYNSSGWHFQSVRHSNARKYGKAGGKYKREMMYSGLCSLPPQQVEAFKGLKQYELTTTKNQLDMPYPLFAKNKPEAKKYVHGKLRKGEKIISIERSYKPTKARAKAIMKDFMNTLEMAELKALSKTSLERPLTQKEYERMMILGKKQIVMHREQIRLFRTANNGRYNPSKKNFGKYIPNNIKGGLADGINPNQLNKEALQKGVSVELEHTNDPKIAREVATDHLVESPKYYDKLEKIEKTPKPINVKIPKYQVKKDKERLEKNLQKEIQRTTSPNEKKRLEKMYEELQKADSHTKLKRFIDEYGNTLSTIGMAMPFYLVTPLILAGIVLGTSLTKELPTDITTVAKLGVPLTGFVIGTEAIKHSVRTINAIRKRQKKIIFEKTKELKENTRLPDKEIRVIAKRIAQQELSKTKITHELV